MLSIDGTLYGLELTGNSASLLKVGSKKRPYMVTRDNQGEIRCNCPGFVYRGRCKHLTALELVNLT